jgi:hypothetical protein
MNIGATEDLLKNAENELKVTFPVGLKNVLLISNGLELLGGWKLLPVFDPSESRKTCSHLGYENIKGRFSYMPDNLFIVATGETGNLLVLINEGGLLGDQIYLWDHETNKIKKWGKDFSYLVQKANIRIEKINKQINRSLKNRLDSDNHLSH